MAAPAAVDIFGVGVPFAEVLGTCGRLLGGAANKARRGDVVEAQEQADAVLQALAQRLRADGAETEAPILPDLEACYQHLRGMGGFSLLNSPLVFELRQAVAALHRAVVGMYGVEVETVPALASGGAA